MVTQLFVVESIAIAMTLIFFISPIKMIINLYQTKDTRTTPFLLYIFTIFSSISLSVYGIQIKAKPVWVTNFFGALLFIIFLAISIYYCDISNRSKLTLILSLYCYVIVQCLISFIYINKETNGRISLVSNVLMNFTPLHQIYLTYIYNDVSYIDIWMSAGLIINNYAWAHYAILKNMNINILIPSAIGVFIALIQFILWFTLKDSDNEKCNNNNSYKDVPVNEIQDRESNQIK